MGGDLAAGQGHPTAYITFLWNTETTRLLSVDVFGLHALCLFSLAGDSHFHTSTSLCGEGYFST